MDPMAKEGARLNGRLEQVNLQIEKLEGQLQRARERRARLVREIAANVEVRRMSQK